MGDGGVWRRAQWKQAFSVCGWFGVKQTFTRVTESQRTGEYLLQVSSPRICLRISPSLAWNEAQLLNDGRHETLNTALLSMQHRVKEQSISYY